MGWATTALSGVMVSTLLTGALTTGIWEWWRKFGVQPEDCFQVPVFFAAPPRGLPPGGSVPYRSGRFGRRRRGSCRAAAVAGTTVAAAGISTAVAAVTGATAAGAAGQFGWAGAVPVPQLEECRQFPGFFAVNAARAAAWAGLSWAWSVTPPLRASAQIQRGNLEICMTPTYAKSPPESTAFTAGNTISATPAQTDCASSERKMIVRTSPRDTFTRCCNSITFAARSFSIVCTPIKIGHAHASRTRNCENGSVFV